MGVAGLADNQYAGRLIPGHFLVQAAGNAMHFQKFRREILMTELTRVFNRSF
jgi:hypothetical protein